MAFLNDLDALAWAAMVAAIVVTCFITIANFQDWWNHLKIDFFDGRGTLIWFFGIAFLVGAISSYSPNANAPRKTVEGVARFVAEVHGRSSYNKYICATSCQLSGGYALDLRDDASESVRIGSRYVFTYLEKPVGGVLNGVSLRVIEISDPDSGRVLYQLDLTNHPYRIAAYLLDAALMICSGLLGGLLNRNRHHDESDKDDSDNGQRGDEEQAAESVSISLGLDSRDST